MLVDKNAILQELDKYRSLLHIKEMQHLDLASKVAGLNRRISELCDKVRQAGGTFDVEGFISKPSQSPLDDSSYQRLSGNRVAVLKRCRNF
jgi:hypothetical protein